MKTLAGTVVFLLAFPIYFEAMPSLIDEDISGGGSSGLTGTLLVSFEEFETTSSESVTLGDGENYDTFFVFESIETGLSIGFVELQISCFDNDDPGPGFTDTVDGESDLSDLEGIEDQTADGACSGGGGGGFTIRWDVTENYTGADYTEDEMSESEIREIWSDNGKGRGTWAATITATIEAAPVAGGFIDDDEEYEISWTAVYFDLAIEAQ
ncbi:MAG: hypothetical protein CMB66_00030 [Euryarchaeota archaeon]|nr:hypothetical protein [Euryarchaeota archaeon]